MSSPAAFHRAVAAGFTERVEGAERLGRWDAAAPVAGWTARDVVRHLVDWLPAFLQGSAGVVLDVGEAPSVEEDPVGAWRAQADAVQALLDDPATASIRVDNPHLGDPTVPEALSRIYSPDVFMHTWDLARATGQAEDLDPDLAAEMFAGMEPMDQMLRASGQFGPRVPVPDDVDPVTRLMAFIGRDPSFRP
ncbi:TIGR03086 family metal-binding protein [Nocardioides sp. GXZ039]|uniref:TIGR03086 family metal-binding protein n=1 Tax=Nocardioides sp. GXZ039 TaxID=3136018 RepID=UPI0030F3BE08